GFRIEAHHLHGFLAARWRLPIPEREHVFIRPGHARNLFHLVDFLLTKGAAEIEILQAMRGDPDVAFGMIDQHAHVGTKREVDAKLHGDQHHGKRNASEGYEKPSLVVKEVLASDRNHEQAALILQFYHVLDKMLFTAEARRRMFRRGTP